MDKINVTELKCASLDPDFLEKWMAGKKPSTLTWNANDGVKVHGVKFHTLADQILKDLCLNNNTISFSADDLRGYIHDHHVSAFLKELVGKGLHDESVEFWKRMCSFCDMIHAYATPTMKSWQEVFWVNEFSFTNIALEGKCYRATLNGRIDCLRLNAHGILELVDFKLSQGDNQKADMVQLAIYAKLIKTIRPGIRFKGVVEYYLPEISRIELEQEILENTFLAVVEPTLRKMFPTQDARLDNPSSEFQKIVQAFESFKLSVEVTSSRNAPQVKRYYLKLAEGLKIASISKLSVDLQVALGLSKPLNISVEKGQVVLDIPRDQPEIALLNKVLSNENWHKDHSSLLFPIGVGMEGHLLKADFSNANTCHALVAGTSGSGKSEFLKSLVASLILSHDESTLKIVLVDPKILTFGGLPDSSFFWKPVITGVTDAVTMLGDAIEEMDRRYLILAEEGLTSLGERFKSKKMDIPWLVLVFDEFADLVLSSKESKKNFEERIVRIAAKGRAAGIHLVLATQRPDKDVVTGLIKANLPLKICLRVTNGVNSKIVLDESGAENLYGKGDLLVNLESTLQRAQSLFIPQEYFIKLFSV